jgi:hypothetical protein
MTLGTASRSLPPQAGASWAEPVPGALAAALRFTAANREAVRLRIAALVHQTSAHVCALARVAGAT